MPEVAAVESVDTGDDGIWEVVVSTSDASCSAKTRVVLVKGPLVEAEMDIKSVGSYDEPVDTDCVSAGTRIVEPVSSAEAVGESDCEVCFDIDIDCEV